MCGIESSLLPRPHLIRAVGLFSLTAIAVNGTVGSGIFVLPAQVAKFLGPAGLAAYVIAALAMCLIVLCFAEVATLFDRSGGPYLYARAAFGNLVGFEIGWMLLLARLTSLAAISNAFAAYLGFFWPAAASGRCNSRSTSSRTITKGRREYVPTAHRAQN